METPAVECVRCGRLFVPRFTFQTIEEEGTTRHFCSQLCRSPELQGGGVSVSCSVCGQTFRPTLGVQLRQTETGRSFFCSETCRQAQRRQVILPATRPARALAVLSQKGGTAKTTTAVSLAAGLARLGHRTLLVDLDPQGSVSVCLGVESPARVHQVLTGQVSVRACATRARDRLDVITADQGLAAVEIELARSDSAQRMSRLQTAMSDLESYEYVVLDCAPALSILNHNALYYAREVLVPVSCDYLALVGVGQVLKTLRHLGEQLGCDIRLAGVLPTFYDVRNKSCVEVVGYLRQAFGARTLPPVRVNTKLAEAPRQQRTIFEYASDSHGARDYIRVVEWLLTANDGCPDEERGTVSCNRPISVTHGW